MLPNVHLGLPLARLRIEVDRRCGAERAVLVAGAGKLIHRTLLVNKRFPPSHFCSSHVFPLTGLAHRCCYDAVAR